MLWPWKYSWFQMRYNKQISGLENNDELRNITRRNHWVVQLILRTCNIIAHFQPIIGSKLQYLLVIIGTIQERDLDEISRKIVCLYLQWVWKWHHIITNEYDVCPPNRRQKARRDHITWTLMVVGIYRIWARKLSFKTFHSTSTCSEKVQFSAE